jgi:deoxyribonuclease-4
MNRMLLGVHVSIAGGVSKAPGRAAELGCTAMQVFVKNASQWKAPPLPDGEAGRYKAELAASKVQSVVAHAAYLINLAAGDRKILAASRRALADEMSRCRELGIGVLILHPGSHGGAGIEEGIALAAESLDAVLAAKGTEGVTVALEITAGQGNSLGRSFEELGAIRDRVGEKGRIAFAFDTCHAFAAGYDQRTRETYAETWKRFADLLGYENLAAVHLNDSVKGLGSHVDRHALIGEGTLGVEPFRFIVNDEKLAGTPKILETPKEKDGQEMDPISMDLLRSLVRMGKR